MRHFSLGFVAAMLLSSAAAAADLPVKAMAPMPPPPSWSGFYLGLNGGYSVGSAAYVQAGGFTSTAFGSNFPLYQLRPQFTEGRACGRPGRIQLADFQSVAVRPGSGLAVG